MGAATPGWIGLSDGATGCRLAVGVGSAHRAEARFLKLLLCRRRRQPGGLGYAHAAADRRPPHPADREQGDQKQRQPSGRGGTDPAQPPQWVEAAPDRTVVLGLVLRRDPCRCGFPASLLVAAGLEKSALEISPETCGTSMRRRPQVLRVLDAVVVELPGSLIRVRPGGGGA